ncbi:MAG: SprT family zinc-dependent metalloprotease [Caldimonas sp.]
MAGFVKSLRRRFVDALQRGLFDEAPASPRGEPPPAPASPEPSEVPSRHPRATRSAVLEGGTVHYALRRSRRRSIGFVVGTDGLVVSAPKWVGLREIDAAVREKAGWIVAKLAEQRERAARTEAARIVWQDGATISYLGRPLKIVLDGRHGLADGEVVLEEGRAGVDGGDDGAEPRRTLHVGLPRDAAEERLRDAVQSWLQREARRIFVLRSAHFAERLGVRVTRLSLSSAQTRWGSASATGAVRLNWRLIHHPPATIDYVVAHELAHLREMNHSPRFWAVVRSVVPDYESAKKQLRDEVAAG